MIGSGKFSLSVATVITLTTRVEHLQVLQATFQILAINPPYIQASGVLEEEYLLYTWDSTGDWHYCLTG